MLDLFFFHFGIFYYYFFLTLSILLDLSMSFNIVLMFWRDKSPSLEVSFFATSLKTQKCSFCKECNYMKLKWTHEKICNLVFVKYTAQGIILIQLNADSLYAFACWPLCFLCLLILMLIFLMLIILMLILIESMSMLIVYWLSDRKITKAYLTNKNTKKHTKHYPPWRL